MDDIKNLYRQVQELAKEIERLKARPSQAAIRPDTIKMRHIAEGIRFIRDGVTADKPTNGEEPQQGAATFFDYTTNTLYIWNRNTNAWKSTVLS